MSNELKVGEFAEIFPEMKGKEFERLMEDIKKNGQLEPIVIDENNEILDGRNRYKACTELEIEPKTKTFKGKDKLQFVLSANMHRRNLTTSQKSLAAVKLLPYFEKEAKARQEAGKEAEEGESGSSAKKVADIVGVSEKNVVKGKAIRKKSDKSIQDMIASGSLSISAAYILIGHCPDKEEQAKIAKKGKKAILDFNKSHSKEPEPKTKSKPEPKAKPELELNIVEAFKKLTEKYKDATKQNYIELLDLVKDIIDMYEIEEDIDAAKKEVV